MPSPLDGLIADAEIGDAAKEFLDSALGRKLLEMAAEQVADALEALETVNPTDTDTIRSLQGRARLGRSFEAWLVELVGRGDEALRIYQQQKET